MLFTYGNSIENDVELDSVICLAVMTRYTFGIDATLCGEWRKKAICLFKKFVNIHNEPELFLTLYKLRILIGITGEIEKNFNEDELLDVVQDEFIEILKLSEEEIQQTYKCKKVDLQRQWGVAGDPAFRIYYHHNFRFDGDEHSKMSSPPWLAIEQADCISNYIETIMVDMKSYIGITTTLPFIPATMLVHKFSVQESINNNAECLKIARKCVEMTKAELHLANYASFYVMLTLPALFKCFLRHSCIQEAVEVLDLFKHFTILYPRLQEIENCNRKRLENIKSLNSVQSLFEEPLSLQQLIKRKTTRQFKTKIPLVLEPETFCSPPNVTFTVSPFL